MSQYPKKAVLKKLPSHLVSVDWLSDNLHEPNLVVLDASLKLDSNEPQLPGARHFDFDRRICDQNNELPHMMPSPELFEQEVRRLGVNRESIIVIYDQTGIYSSPRAWWMFKAMGHDQVAVLDGGMPAWLHAGLVTQPADYSSPASGKFVARPRPELFCDANSVVSELNHKTTAIIDARSKGRFEGVAPEPRAGLRSGHIPGAVNLPFSDVIEDGHMRPVDEIADLFNSITANPQKIIFSCGSGVTACILALAADLAGYENISVYDGSWSEWWKVSSLPVEMGPAFFHPKNY